MRTLLLWLLFVMAAGCKDFSNLKDHTQNTQSAPATPQPGSTNYQRFVFPTKSEPFLEASVALDTKTGQLCKTYPWPDSSKGPRGLPLCSMLPASSFVGSYKTYMGHTYFFDGNVWEKGSKAQSYLELESGTFVPASDDQYDPLSLFTKEEKSKRTLTEAQIRRVASEFGVSYEEAREEAKSHGYQVPPKR